MQKLKLDLDRLIVESFDSDASGIARRGTVRAHSEMTVGAFTCVVNTCDSCYDSCDSCRASCGGGCTGYSYYGSCVDPSCNTCLTNCQQESCVASCP
ncbi:MAG TPA: hypothetical protein VLK84_13265 [Longimicrobium sp.]|nr:hypothetical protein [Longimicrobium sp.]